MRNLRILCLGLCLIPGLVPAAQEQHRYLETTGSRTVAFDWSVAQDGNGLRIVASEPGNRFLTLCDETGITNLWQLNDGRHDIRAKRSGDRLILRGTRDGQPYSEEHTLDAAPWYQALSYSLRVWLESAADSTEFWTLRPDTLEAVKLSARRIGVEPLQTRAGTVEAVHVQVRARGMLAPFWKADYWFRADNHLFVKYQAVNGLPGSPETVIELLPDVRAAKTPPPAIGM